MKVSVETTSGSIYTFDSKLMRYTRYNSRGYWGEPETINDEGSLESWPDFKIGESFYFNHKRTTPVTLIKLESE